MSHGTTAPARGTLPAGGSHAIAANLLAAWPGQRAARLHSAQILRAG